MATGPTHLRALANPIACIRYSLTLPPKKDLKRVYRINIHFWPFILLNKVNMLLSKILIFQTFHLYYFATLFLKDLTFVFLFIVLKILSSVLRIVEIISFFKRYTLLS